MKQVAEPKTQQHDTGDADGGVKETRAPRLQDLMQVHAKTESDDGSLQQEFRQPFAFTLKGVHGGKSKDKATQQREGRRDQAGRSQNQRQKEDALAHGSSLRDRASGVQAVVLMGD